MTIPVFILFGGIDSASVLNEQKCIVQMGYMYLLHLYGPCTFPQFNFSSFYLYTEGLLGSNVNVARDRIQFVP